MRKTFKVEIVSEDGESPVGIVRKVDGFNSIECLGLARLICDIYAAEVLATGGKVEGGTKWPTILSQN